MPDEDDVEVGLPEDIEEIADEEIESVPEEVIEEESEEPAAPKTSRSQERIRALSEETRREREARVQAEQRAELLERQQREAMEAARQQQEMDDQNLPYEQRLQRWAERRDQQFQQQLRMTQSQMMDQSDKTQYDLKAATDPRYKKYASRVEEHISKMRSQGTNAPREAVLKFLIGEDALSEKARTSAGKQKTAAATRVAAARGAPMGSRPDVGSRSQRIKSLEERLSDQPL